MEILREYLKYDPESIEWISLDKTKVKQRLFRASWKILFFQTMSDCIIVLTNKEKLNDTQNLVDKYKCTCDDHKPLLREILLLLNM